MKIAIVGSRDYPRLNEVAEYVQALPADTIVVSGGANGVDTIAELTALDCGMATEIFYPDWKRHGKSAGYIRNEQIVKAADKVVCFWHNQSRGTAHSIRLARQHGKELEVHEA